MDRNLIGPPLDLVDSSFYGGIAEQRRNGRVERGARRRSIAREKSPADVTPRRHARNSRFGSDGLDPHFARPRLRARQYRNTMFVRIEDRLVAFDARAKLGR